MGRCGSERVRSHFSIDVMCGALDELYTGLLGQVLPGDAVQVEGTAEVHVATDVLRSA